MKKNISLFTTILLGFTTICCFAQETALKINNKMGKPTTEELNLTVYEPEPEAEAVVLYDATEAVYRWGTDDFRINYTHKTRIKILKEEGIDYANVVITLYESSANHSNKEAMSGLKAYAYNMENGKMVKSKMGKDQVFKERINQNLTQVKFTIPQVKVGTIIEYEYDIISDFYYNLESWEAQWEIPVLYTEYEIGIPEYFVFDIDVRGSHSLHREDKHINMTFTAFGDTFTCNGNNIKFIGEQIPSLKDDKFVWCIDNYRAQVEFELRSIEIPGSVYRYYTQTWEEIDNALLEDEAFGGCLKMDNPFKEEMKALPLKETKDIEKRIGMVYQLLCSKLKWNGRYTLGGRSVKEILKDGSGSNADLNFIFISMLKDAGIRAVPAVMSRRDLPMLPSRPSIDNLNTFVVAIAKDNSTNSTFTFFDSSNRYGYLNTLPEILMTDRARIIGTGDKWVNLNEISKNEIKTVIDTKVTPEGKIIGERTSNYTGQYAAKIKRTFFSAEDSLTYIKNFNNKNNVTITQYQLNGINEFTSDIQEQMAFEKECSVNGNIMYINPLIFLHCEESPFKQSERKLPIEFSYTEQISMTISMTLPEGFVIDDLPKSKRLETSKKEISALYLITQNENKITIRYNFKLNKIIFNNTQYTGLKQFWDELADINNAQIVIKKS